MNNVTWLQFRLVACNYSGWNVLYNYFIACIRCVTGCDLQKCVMMFYYMHQNCGQDFNFCPLGSSSTYVGFTLMEALTELTWQNPPFRQELGLQSLTLRSQFVPAHPTAQLHWYPFTTFWNKCAHTSMQVCGGPQSWHYSAWINLTELQVDQNWVCLQKKSNSSLSEM